MGADAKRRRRRRRAEPHARTGRLLRAAERMRATADERADEAALWAEMAALPDNDDVN